MGAPRTRPAIWKVFTDKPGKAVNLSDIATATGFRAEQIQHQVRALIKDGHPITVLIAAQSWVYNPEPVADQKPAKIPGDIGDLFEVMGHTRDGGLILRDDTGLLYRAKEME